MSPPASTPGSEPKWDPFGPSFVVLIGGGTTQTIFKVSESFLAHYSGYFRTMTSNTIMSPILPYSSDAEIRLPGDDPEVFSMVLHYLYHRRFLDSTIHPCHLLSFDKIIDIWSFGEARVIPLIQNAVADLFGDKIKLSKSLPDRWSIEYLWERTEKGSQLRKMLVALVREMWMPDGHKHTIWGELVDGRSEDPERLVWLVEALLDSKHEVRVSAKARRRMESCEWHVHEDFVWCEGSEEASLDDQRDLMAAKRRERAASWSS
ncbi:hypothetical protein DOTSEDRAFT_23332 [Dothistroma septosporum NZE10]|uniref:BTB domain-containing protein n=1 Tax=Dothistroma septosporum (strain NZE10 / CBS 128990) TaxID=675120 RepID=N1PSE1_DOTSN|nr:hypothetical protein DOTSEDRAFT_23332 [Dothistroma septosporum NZE10]